MKKHTLRIVCCCLAVLLLAGCSVPATQTENTPPTTQPSEEPTQTQRDDNTFVFSGGVYSKINQNTALFVSSYDFKSGNGMEYADQLCKDFSACDKECYVWLTDFAEQDGKIDFDVKSKQTIAGFHYNGTEFSSQKMTAELSLGQYINEKTGELLFEEPQENSYDAHVIAPDQAALIGDAAASYQAIADAIESRNNTVTVPSQNDYDSALQVLLFCNPLMQLVKNIEYDSSAKTVSIEYVYSEEEHELEIQAWHESITQILRNLSSSKNDQEIAYKLYAEMAAGIDLSDDDEIEIDGYDVLTEQCGSAEGIVQAYQYMLLQAGLQCWTVTGKTPSDECHTWVIAELDGEYYHIDPVMEIMSGGEKFTYFGMSDQLRSISCQQPWAFESPLAEVPICPNDLDVTETEVSFGEANGIGTTIGLGIITGLASTTAGKATAPAIGKLLETIGIINEDNTLTKDDLVTIESNIKQANGKLDTLLNDTKQLNAKLSDIEKNLLRSVDRNELGIRMTLINEYISKVDTAFETYKGMVSDCAADQKLLDEFMQSETVKHLPHIINYINAEMVESSAGTQTPIMELVNRYMKQVLPFAHESMEKHQVFVDYMKNVQLKALILYVEYCNYYRAENERTYSRLADTMIKRVQDHLQRQQETVEDAPLIVSQNQYGTVYQLISNYNGLKLCFNSKPVPQDVFIHESDEDDGPDNYYSLDGVVTIDYFKKFFETKKIYGEEALSNLAFINKHSNAGIKATYWITKAAQRTGCWNKWRYAPIMEINTYDATSGFTMGDETSIFVWADEFPEFWWSRYYYR